VFYSLLKGYARLAIKIYCPKLVVNKLQLLQQDGPLLLACNHPNSFLDGVIITTLFDTPVYSLARGDAFAKPAINSFLRRLKLLPVYRTSEGVENLGHNYTTFDACREAFLKKGVVLIFSEGRCENEWHLRPLRKGTARLAISAWDRGIALRVVPVGINYSSFGKFGKEVHLFFGEPLQQETINASTDGKRLLQFNQQLEEQLSALVYEIDPADRNKLRSKFPIGLRPLHYLLLPLALAGWILHAPLFYCIKLISFFFLKTGHYDSVLHALAMLLYPFYLLLITLVAVSFIGIIAFLLFPLSLITSWALVQVKYAMNG